MQLVNKKTKSGVNKHDLSLMKPISKFLGACAENIWLSNAAVRIAVDFRNSIETMTYIVKKQEQDQSDYFMKLNLIDRYIQNVHSVTMEINKKSAPWHQVLKRNP